jgi:pimeloyl-ACP methyl ester carboxylesterase
MHTITSHDGTPIAYDQAGDGPTLIIVAGALSFRDFEGAHELVSRLAPHFTVVNYDRRGRGDSGDTPPYALEREVEDIAALIAAAGTPAYLYGISSGAALALEAASRLPRQVAGLLLYEPPFILEGSRPPVPTSYGAQLDKALAEGRRGDAVEIFMTVAVGIPAEFVAQMRYGGGLDTGDPNGERMAPPAWAQMETVAHTLPYDLAAMQGTLYGVRSLPAHWAAAAQPVLVATGGDSEPFFHDAARALVALLPRAEHRILEGQSHAVAPAAVASLMIDFFTGEPARPHGPI